MENIQTCIIDDCDRPVRVQLRGWCRAHYLRWYKYGDPLIDKTRRRGSCSIEDCEREHWCHGYCTNHYRRWKRYGDPLAEDQRTSTSGNYRGDAVGYHGIHHRLRAVRGRPEDHACRHCGDQAKDWAYDHEDPDERVDDRIKRPYSLDLDHYMPLCKGCHLRFDGAIKAPA